MDAVPLIHAEHMARTAALIEGFGIPSQRYLERARISPDLRDKPVGFVNGRSLWTLIGLASRTEGLGGAWLQVAPRNDWRRAGWAPALRHAVTLRDALQAMCRSYVRQIPMLFSAPIPGPGTTGVDFDRETGLADSNLLTLLTPKDPHPLFGGGFMLALGFSSFFPTATDDDLGVKQWGIGPAAGVVWKNERVTVGAAPKYFFEFASEDTSRPDLNQGEILYFFFWNLPNAWQIGFNPTITYDHRAAAHNKWNVPVGVVIAKTTKVGSLPVKFQLGVEYSVVSQDDFGKRLLLKFNVIPVIRSLIQGPLF